MTRVTVGGMSLKSYASEIEVASLAARRAGALAAGYLHAGLTVERKEGDEPVTRADREASDLLVAAIGAAFPHDLIVSEEAPEAAARLGTLERVWFIDPIDGTNDFIQRLPGFAVMVGLCVDGEPTVGVVFQPMTDKLYTAAPGHGAWLERAGGARSALSTTATTTVEELRLVASRSHRTAQIDDVKRVLGVSDELNVGSVGLKLGLIAEGTRDLYVNPASKCKAWDTCAPQAILTAAGGTLTDVHGRALGYGSITLGGARGLVASNGAAHAGVIAKLAPLFAPS